MAAETPTIVFVHGGWADAAGFDGSIRALRENLYGRHQAALGELLVMCRLYASRRHIQVTDAFDRLEKQLGIEYLVGLRRIHRPASLAARR